MHRTKWYHKYYCYVPFHTPHRLTMKSSSHSQGFALSSVLFLSVVNCSLLCRSYHHYHHHIHCQLPTPPWGYSSPCSLPVPVQWYGAIPFWYCWMLVVTTGFHWHACGGSPSYSSACPPPPPFFRPSFPNFLQCQGQEYNRYEFNVSPEINDFHFSTYVVMYNWTSTIVLAVHFRPLSQHSQHVFSAPWWSAVLAHTITCSPRTPQVCTMLSPPHQGGWYVRLVWAKSNWNPL